MAASVDPCANELPTSVELSTIMSRACISFVMNQGPDLSGGMYPFFSSLALYPILSYSIPSAQNLA